MGRMAHKLGAGGKVRVVRALSQRGTQSYTIVLLEARYEISINTSDYGWISLGEYESTSGECVVMLHDTGDPNHIIIGDAVKWVYVGERG